MLEVPELTDSATVAAVCFRVWEPFEFAVEPERDPPIRVVSDVSGPGDDVRRHRVVDSSDEQRTLCSVDRAAAQDVLRVLAFARPAAGADAESPGEAQVPAAYDHGGDLLRAPFVHDEPVVFDALAAVLRELTAPFEAGIERVEDTVRCNGVTPLRLLRGLQRNPRVVLLLGDGVGAPTNRAVRATAAVALRAWQLRSPPVVTLQQWAPLQLLRSAPGVLALQQ